jgi:DMSO/TMAO reductase YedYZ molybdopterin-dependent catalytic subunit
MTRRTLLFLPGLGWRLSQAESAREPKNISFPLATIENSVTPSELFFVRDHFPEPELSLDSWKLSVEGLVTRRLELTLADLLESPTRKVEAVLECAGNAAGGAAVGNALWEGVPMADLLKQAGAQPDATMVMFEGADAGRLLQDSPELPYTQLLPIEKCRKPESMVALKLNDRLLPRKNGFPARALLPGWYGMDSVKWLRRIVVLGPNDPPEAFRASGMAKVYNRIVETGPGSRTVKRLTAVQVKSEIAWPADQAKLPAARHTVRGFAWSGGGPIRMVEFSADGGRSWKAAKLDGAPKPFAWIRWTCAWAAPRGEHVLMSRATDVAGGTQPLKREAGRKDGYELNFCAPVRCTVG